MASVADDETAKLWDVYSGRLLRSFYAGLEIRLSLVALSPDGRLLVVGTDRGGLVIWDTRDGREVVSEPGTGGGDIHWILWSPDSRLIVIGGHDEKGNDETFRVVVIDSTKIEDPVDLGFLRDYKGSVSGKTAGHLLSDGRSLAFCCTAGSRRTVTIWDITTGVERPGFDVNDAEHLVVSREGLIAVVNSRSVDLFSAIPVPLRTTQAHTDYIGNIFFSTDGKTLYGLDYNGKLIGWDVSSGRKMSTITAPTGTPPLRNFKALLPDGRHVIATVGPSILVRDLTTGAVVRTIGEKVDRVFTLASLADQRQVLSGGVNTLAEWDVVVGRHVRNLDVKDGGLYAVQATADSSKLLLGHQRRLMRVVDTGSGRELARMTDALRPLTPKQQRDGMGRAVWEATADVLSRSWAFALSGDGTLAAHGRNDGLIRVFATANPPKLIGSIEKAHGASDVEDPGHPITALALSPRNNLLASAGQDKKAKLWDPKTMQLIKELEGHTWSVMSLAWLPDGKQLLTGSGDRTIIQWNTETGQSILKIEAHDGVVRALAVSPDGTLAVSGGSEGVVKVWDLATGKQKHVLTGHVGEVTAVGISRDGRRVLSGGDDATLKVWDAHTGKLLGSFIAAANGEWLVMTPDGFFAASKAGAPILSIVRGYDITTIDQVHQSLFNPDLVRESLAADPRNEVQEAGKIINLAKVLDSGPAPRVIITSHPSGANSTKDVVAVSARISDAGKGIGRIEWRVNGVTAAVGATKAGEREATPTRELALDPGDNTIEVVAYNGSNLLASLPAKTMIKLTGPTQRVRPNLHILAIGIDKYVDKGGFEELRLAVKGAKSVVRDFKQAGASQYADVKPTLALDEKASRANLERLIDEVASEIHPRDTFIFFAAGHGISHHGQFYLIPQDYTGGADPAALKSKAIGQQQLQDWFANRIKAKKAVILLDTCESGALIAGHLRSRADSAAAEASVGRLHEATGRPVLTAAALGEDAWEGRIAQSGETHGVFTWALLDALRNSDRDNNGTIELSELVAHVQDLVPKAKLKRFLVDMPLAGIQSARFGSRGENFVLVRRLQ